MAQQESTNALSRTDSFQYPSAHDGHLNDLQKDTLQQFKNLCQDKGYFTPADGSGKPASHDNETLLSVPSHPPDSLPSHLTLALTDVI